MSRSDDGQRFEAVDGKRISRSGRCVTGERIVFTLGICLCLVLFLFDRSTGTYLLGTWETERIDYGESRRKPRPLGAWRELRSRCN
ncbi:hypothetical protein [Halovivax cerinus]|uniref:hypothetical protein n=1 Tax=Halovivax cerinus TaxID=1487865 RepID=UPI0036D39130